MDAVANELKKVSPVFISNFNTSDFLGNNYDIYTYINDKIYLDL